MCDSSHLLPRRSAGTHRKPFSTIAERNKVVVDPMSFSRRGYAARSGRSYSLRSEEHTSELQSRLHLVCRLLLEKKKQANMERGRSTCMCRRRGSERYA